MQRWLIPLLLSSASANKELFRAIDADNAAMVNVALKSGKSGLVNEPDDTGATPLMHATLKGKHRAFKVMSQTSAFCLPAVSALVAYEPQ